MLQSIFGRGLNHIDPAQATLQLKQKPAPFLLDVRQPEEFRQEHIAGAKLIPLGELQTRLHELPRDRQIICVCRSGSRSGSATRMLASAGYQAANLRGGMIGWRRSGLPTQRGSGR